MKRVLPLLVVLCVAGSAHAQQPTPAPTPATAGSAATPAAPAAPKAKAWFEQLADRPIEEEGNFWLPKAVNQAADESDLMFIAALALSIFFFVAIAGAVIYLVVKYRHRPGHKSEPSAAHNDALEITWTIIPTIICVFLFWYGWRSYIRVVTPPAHAVEIQVLAEKWRWGFTHQNGVTDTNLHVPPYTAVRLVMTSKDVLHSFYAPAMRVKQDVVPRRYTYAWFIANKPGVYRLTCAEYCGTEHSQMACQEYAEDRSCRKRAVVVVHTSMAEYERYLNDAAKPPSSPVEWGAQLYSKKGCNACHSIDGSVKIGPSWKQAGEWGKSITVEEGPVTMDENYIRESIEFPAKKGRPGFQRTMPVVDLKAPEKEALIAYIKSLRQ